MRWESGRRKHKNIVAFSTKVQSSPPKQHGQTSSSAILTRHLADLITFLSLVSETFFRTCTETYLPLSRIFSFRFHSLLFNKIRRTFLFLRLCYKLLYTNDYTESIHVHKSFLRNNHTHAVLYGIIYWLYKK